MPYSLATTLPQEFFLVGEGKEYRLEIRRATTGMLEERNKLMHSGTWIDIGGSDEKYSFDLSVKEIRMLEAFLTLADCDICEDDGSPLFRFENEAISMTYEEFQLAWARLPGEYQDGIVSCVCAVNLLWVPFEVSNG